MEFCNTLITWYLEEKRDLPWRNSTNPYTIWLSEIILQQTKVAQGMAYYLAFVDAFPTVFDLANAKEGQVLKLWQGLGYYSRARNLHLTAKHIAFEKNGVFPDNYKDLLRLKGVGEYTAAAIASFAYNEPVAVVDGNVFRVLARYLDIDLDISATANKKEFQKIAQELLPKNNAAIFNQAMMEFGAMQCTPKNPNCSNCIFNTSCAALQKNKVALLPIKTKKTKVSDKFFNFLVFLDPKGNSIIEKRTQNGIWKHLYQFPLIETTEISHETAIREILENQYKKEIITIEKQNQQPILHKLSHQNLYITFWEVQQNQLLENGLSFSEIKKYPFPIVIANFLEKYV